VAASQGVVQLSYGLVLPFVPLFVLRLGVTDRTELTLWAGVMAGASSFTGALASPLWGLLADRFGRKRMLLRSLIAGWVCLTLMGSVTSVGQLFALRMAQGALAGSHSAASMLIARVAPSSRTGFAFGLLNTGGQLGNLAGPLAGGVLLVLVGFGTTFSLAGGLLLLCVLAVIFQVADVKDAPAAASRGGNPLLDAIRPFGWPALRPVLLATVITTVAFTGTSSLLAIYVLDLASPSWMSTEFAIGAAVGLGALAAAVSMPIFGGIADRRDARVVLVVSILGMALVLAPQAIAPDVVAFIALRGLSGVCLAGITCSMAVLTRAAAPRGAEGRVFAALGAAQQVGWGIGPLLGGGIAATLGIPALYVIAAVACAVAAIPLLRLPAQSAVPAA
jgi:DHA1 family multidrug resistance protein-like MFS transporter